MFDAERFLKDYGISYVTSGKNTSVGWVQISCPFCADPSYHGGISITGAYNCWKCGKKSLYSVISTILNISYVDVKEIVDKYTYNYKRSREREVTNYENESLELPIGTGGLKSVHEKYLLSRNFDCDKLEKFRLMGTNHIGDYSFRVIIPIFYNGKMVSYTGRAIYEDMEPKYKTCSKKEEIIPHKNILYNLDNSIKDTVIVVEGPTDVWRIGDDCVATFGVNFTLQQVKNLVLRYKKIYVLYDSDPAGVQQSEKLVWDLDSLGVEAYRVDLDCGDPAGMGVADVMVLKRSIFL